MASSSYIAPEANMASSSSSETGFSGGRNALAGPTGDNFSQYQIQISRSPSTDYDPTGDGIVEYSPSEDEEEEDDIESSFLSQERRVAASPSPAESTPPTEYAASSKSTTPFKKTPLKKTPIKETSIKSTPPSSPPTKVKLELKGTPPAQAQQSKKQYLTASPHRSLKSTSSKPILVDFHPRNSSLEQIQALRARLDMGEELVYKTQVNLLQWQKNIEAQVKDLKEEIRETNIETKKRQDKLQDQQDQLEEKQEVTDSRSARNERRLAEVEITIEDVIGKPPNLPGLFPPGHSSYFSGPTSPSRLPGAWGPRSSRSSRTSRTGSAAPLPSIEISDAVKSIKPTLCGRSSYSVDTASPPDMSPSIGSKRKSEDLESDEKDAEVRGAKKQKKTASKAKKQPARKNTANTTKTAPKKTTTPPQSQKRKAEGDLEACGKDTGKKDSGDEDTQSPDNRPAEMTANAPLYGGCEPMSPSPLPKETDTAPKGHKRKAEEVEDDGKVEGKKNRDNESRKRPIKKVKTVKKSGTEPKQTVTTSKKTDTVPKGQKRKAEEEVEEGSEDEGEKNQDDSSDKRPNKKVKTAKKSDTKPQQTVSTSKKTTTKPKGSKRKVEKPPKENDGKTTRGDAKEDIKEVEEKPVKAPKKRTAKPVKPAVPGTRTGLRSQKKEPAPA
ncbi:hypothetical protein CLIM01_11197 [Colletotrichum limetticola]|uniref:AT hook domain-containing protein n=1 Tax=Colletotrichum limetticola TaxID=1209924 RepID=A0ABQ9PJQ2_9PEZI|nr:hypothetical protein CLIM01_11197 [Colletotrichum limetticola]